MKTFLLALLAAFIFSPAAYGAEPRVSDETTSCIECHASLNPGMVADWKKSRMAKMTPAKARGMPEKERRVSFSDLSGELSDVVVGCAECHTLNPEKHKDSFEHNGFKVHVVVTPQDCATCHPVEVGQYGKNLMSHAYGNLQKNPVYHDLMRSITGAQIFKEGKTVLKDPDPETLGDACLHCHGTVVKVKGMATRSTDQGDMDFPVLSGWPNQGVGRINPDGSKGACTACHTRHQFAIQMARKPYTCSQCHKGPDVPAYKVYEVSKHGNTFAALGKDWDYGSVPWTVGKNFTAPTCAACHVSLVVSEDGAVLGERTHQMNDRLSWRIFGLIYAHPHPRSPDTSIIKNKAGLTLPTELTGEPVARYLISPKEQRERQKAMQRVCLACHSEGWVKNHYARFENTLKTTNEMTLTATRILLSAYEKGAARGLAEKESVFDEAIEKKWVEQWLFFANSTRYSAAMTGADYGTFANGRWYMSRNIQEMMDWLEFKQKGR